MESKLKLGRYQHYKGNYYEVIALAKHSETLEEMVVYKSIVKGLIWVRPLKMFVEDVSVDDKKVPRFKFVV